MIQRIQTVYFFLVFCLTGSLFFLPFATLLLLIDAGTVAVLAFVAIFLFKKRKLQIKTAWFIMLLLVIAIVLFLVKEDGFSISGITYPILIPFIAGIFDYLAIRAVKKDEQLIRSLDRLR
ncbi:MAG: DUF4293 domain-containing protein [Dysgonamonadaceae bacterium]|jgi:cell division protein FtsW (lipid II flippase)|nr:DUF4293 domain-containing protein [Dysgonamonadaceae bacterium]